MGLSCGPRGSLPWSHALKTLTLAVCLGVCILRASAQGAGAEVIDAAVGETATIPAPVTVKTFSFSWYRGTAVAASQLICTYFVSSPEQVNGPQYTGRESGRPDGALQIRDLRTNYTGNYTVNVIVSGASPVEATRQLRVSENVSIPVIQAMPQNPVENGSLDLFCNASGTDVSYQWYQDDKLITSGGRINITSNSQALTLSPCTRSDTGTSFACRASNAVSHSTSSQYILTVSYGPDTPVISVNPKESAYAAGSAITFSCTAASHPPALYTWLLNGESLLNTGPELVIHSLTLADSGNFTCNTSNSVTHLSKHTLWGIRVLELVTKPTVKYVSSQLVENRGPVEITCDTPSVPVTIFWSFNGSQTLPGNIILSPDNRTLTISNVSRGDSGIYQCTALNPVSNSTSDPQTLTVAYGPENVKITPPGSQLLQVGNKLSLSCTAQSVPEVQYQWFLNDTNLNRPGNTYTVEKVSSQNYGNYTCVAHNTYTSLSANTSVFITVNGTDPSSGGSPDLSGGAIAGIVIGVLAVIIVVCVLVYIFVIKKPASGHPPEGSTTDAASSKNAASTNPKVNGTAEDIQYSSVNFMPKGSTPLKPISNENTVYSEVRRS
ncbi:carcinoembryonic antigen-related cell adhesion molecule 5-like [Pleurodeles waltl]|uniref:carcinoembryonic antigen-related cell adhesion molecule 5-like n=1 Tax=Pleurodeles waltl TaxID=8319 RepID=UPI0037093E76